MLDTQEDRQARVEVLDSSLHFCATVDLKGQLFGFWSTWAPWPGGLLEA